MRVIAPEREPVHTGTWNIAIARSGRIEMLGMLACSVVVAFGLLLTYSARIARTAEADAQAGSTLNLHRLSGPVDLVPLLTMFETMPERQVVALAVFERAASGSTRLEHVGALARVMIPAEDVQRDARLLQLRRRMAQNPDAAGVPVLTTSDIAALKPRLAVRTPGEYGAAFRRAAAWFFSAFWITHLVRLWRRADDEPLLLPVLLLLCGLGLMTMLALRDPLRDTISASAFVSGVVMGLVALVCASEIDFETSRLRRAVLTPLGLALALAALLLVFGSGPGSSGVKVNLFGFQPVEVIRLLVITSLAAYFARRLDFLRELSDRCSSAWRCCSASSACRRISVRPSFCRSSSWRSTEWREGGPLS
jgi:hypothetical protein